MLKIKDNVELKELERFGFKKRNNPSCEIYDFHNDVNFVSMSVSSVTRLIDCGIYFGDDEDLNVLFDLIKAKFVERVKVK